MAGAPDARTRRRLVALAAGAFALGLAGVRPTQAQVPPRPEKPRIRLAVGGRASLYYLPLMLAEQLGYFRAEGLEVQLADHAGGALALQALLGGECDVVAGAYEHTLLQQAQGRALQSFVVLGRAPQIALGISMKTLAHWQGAADLRGHRVGVSVPESSTHMVLRRYLREHGVPEAAVQVVAVGTSHRAVEALRAGEIDALSNVEPVISLLEARSEVRIVADTRSLKGTVALFGGPMPAACLYADAGFVRTHPGTCQALAHGSVRALKWLRTAGPSDLMQVVPRADQLGDAGLFVAAFQKVSEAFAPDGLMPEGGPATALRAMLELRADIAPERIDLTRSYTDRFALAAKQRFKA